METLLDIRSLDKSFPGVQALSDIDFDLYGGEVHCLVGENGAGKSTLVEILAGNYRPDSGQLLIGGDSYSYLSPAKSLAIGIETVHQEDQLVPAGNSCFRVPQDVVPVDATNPVVKQG